MELQQAGAAAPCGRRCTIRQVFLGQEVATFTAGATEEDMGLANSRQPLLPLPNQERIQETNRNPTDTPKDAYQAPVKDLVAGDPLRETQQLLLWSAVPNALGGVPSTTDSTDRGEAATPQAASPSGALLHGLDDAGLRSAMRPPAFFPQQDWLRHLLLQVIEDAQLLFSSLWEGCACTTLGLPRKTCSSSPSAGVLDPVIAFAACGPSAPKRRLGGGGSKGQPIEAKTNAVFFPGIEANSPRDLERQQPSGDSQAAEEQQQQDATETETNIEEVNPPTAREYISAAMSWATRQLEDPHLFPQSPKAAHSGVFAASGGDKQEETLRSVASLMVRRLLRCYAHVYLWHLHLLQQHGAVGHANRCLKRLIFLAVDAQLLDGNDGSLEPIRSLADAWLRQASTAHTPEDGQVPAASPAAEEAESAPPPDDWLVPALEKAEQCLGVLDQEEYPFFGAPNVTADGPPGPPTDGGHMYI